MTRFVVALFLLMPAGCGGNARIPPCNAVIFLFGAADLTLDCPARGTLPQLEQMTK